MDERLGFERLYRQHAGRVLTFARRRGAAGDADDVVAEVFLAAWRRWDERPADPLPWLLGIARGVLANRRRSADRAGALRDRLRSTDLPVAGDPDCGSVDTRVIEALRQLSSADQELLLLVAWEGLSRRQIAAMLGVSPGTVAVRLHRARVRLVHALRRGQSAPHDAPLRSEGATG